MTVVGRSVLLRFATAAADSFLLSTAAACEMPAAASSAHVSNALDVSLGGCVKWQGPELACTYWQHGHC